MAPTLAPQAIHDDLGVLPRCALGSQGVGTTINAGAPSAASLELKIEKALEWNTSLNATLIT